MGKHHRKWYIDEPIASNKRVEDMMDDLEDYEDERRSMPCGGKKRKKKSK